MGKAIRVEDQELLRAFQEGVDYLIAGKRRFLLVEIDEEGGTGGSYDVTDPAEADIVREALQDTSRSLTGEKAREYLKASLKDHGVG